MTTTVSTDEEAAVRAALRAVYTGWEKNDADAFTAPYAENATATLPGVFLPNREAVRSTMAAMFDGALKGSKAIYEVRTIRFLSPDVAIVTSKGSVVYAGAGSPSNDTKALETWVLSKKSGEWLVEAFQNSPENAA
ncbi:SgcJ/EcaC family oxidoreductase [Nocardia fusca]|uniref:SgcJ/EcaC family oxidoreductase n=1 Tax=Nocardia fusca TaxID=941183 RepID=UPI0037C6F331